MNTEFDFLFICIFKLRLINIGNMNAIAFEQNFKQTTIYLK